MSDTLSRDELTGFTRVANICVRAFLHLPDAELIKDMQEVAHAFNSDAFDNIIADKALIQRFHDRFFVPTSSVYVALYEDAVRGGEQTNGKFRYGTTTGYYFDHVVKCYQALDFDISRLDVSDIMRTHVKASSFACELAFVSALADQALNQAASDSAVARRCIELARRFVREHPAQWFRQASELLCAGDDDFYARVCVLAADTLEATWLAQGEE